MEAIVGRSQQHNSGSVAKPQKERWQGAGIPVGHPGILEKLGGGRPLDGSQRTKAGLKRKGKKKKKGGEKGDVRDL